MPLYDYACRSCGNSFEIRQSYQEDSLTECPQCHGEIRRVINQVGLVFKGGGYYITEGRTAGSAAEGKDAAGQDSGAGDDSEKAKTANGERERKTEDQGKDRAEGADGKSGEKPVDTAATATPATASPSSPPAASPTAPGTAASSPAAPSKAAPSTTGGGQGSADR